LTISTHFNPTLVQLEYYDRMRLWFKKYLFQSHIGAIRIE